MVSLTHLDGQGQVRMVDISEKNATLRTATAQGVVVMSPQTLELIQTYGTKKGNVFETARIAGIMAAKRTWELIPMCHPILLTHVHIDFFPDPATGSVRIEASVRVRGQTGVEMEALSAAAVAALTIYDMCKSYDRSMTISDLFLLEKTGGRSGNFRRGDSG